MKSHLLLIVSMVCFSVGNSQEFEWVWSYDIPACNDVAALAVDDSGNIYTTGIFNAPYILPFTGTAYIQKTNPGGQVIWTEYMEGLLQISDMALTGNNPVIIGQSSAPFSYMDEIYGLDTFYMFIMKINSMGAVEWILTDTEKYGLNTNISVDSPGNIAFHIRGKSNQGDHVWIMDPDGNILQTKTISALMTTIVDLFYFEGRIYLSGGLTGASGLTVDTIYIPQSSVSKTTFVLALDENLQGTWVALDTTITNTDGKVVAHASGIYAYESNINTGLGMANYLKRFDFEGQLQKKVPAPVFSSGTLRPDMVVNDSAVALFVKNNNNSNSHKVAIAGHDLDIKAELLITGPSNAYSGQIGTNGNDLFIANIHTGELAFDGGMILPVSNSDRKLFTAKISMPEITTGSQHNEQGPQTITLFPNPATGSITISRSSNVNTPSDLFIFNASGQVVYQASFQDKQVSLNIEFLPAGWYLLKMNEWHGMSYSRTFIRN
jgi:hypothetical protein